MHSSKCEMQLQSYGTRSLLFASDISNTIFSATFSLLRSMNENFNVTIFHTVVLRISLLRTGKHNKYYFIYLFTCCV